jgi:hypothetical protein
MGVLFVYSLKKGMKHQWGMVIPWMILLLIPLIQAQLSGLLSYRINTIIIWQPEYLASIGKTNSWWDLSGIFINHFLKHLNPDYLFFKGDPDYAHSTQRAGILSGLDIIAFGLLTISFMISLWRNSWNSRNIWQPNSRWMIGCLVLFFIGIIPSALTFLDIPNALRMNLSWPFLCLLTGFICANICQYKRWLAVVLLAIVIIYTSTFLKDYFTNYAQRSKGMFSFLTLEQAQQNKDMNDWLDFVATYRGKDYHARYHLMHDLGKTCSESYNMWINVNKILEITNNKPR